MKEALQTQSGKESILPTFTCSLKGKNIRILKDSGCQSHFIEENLAKKLNLKIIKSNFPLTVNGFNTSKEYKTNIVEAELYYGNKSCRVEAICVPSIRTKLKLPGLGKLVGHCQEKGFTLADTRLSKHDDEISNIEFILETSDAHFLPESTVLFGKNPPSVYSNTPKGILLTGGIQRIFKNLEYLPSVFEKKLNQNEKNLVSKPDVQKGWCALASWYKSSGKGEIKQEVQSNFKILNKEGKVQERARKGK